MRVLKNLVGLLELMGLLLLITRIPLLNWNPEQSLQASQMELFLLRNNLQRCSGSVPQFLAAQTPLTIQEAVPLTVGSSLSTRNAPYIKAETRLWDSAPSECSPEAECSTSCMSPLPELSKKSLPNWEGGSECHPYSVWS